MTDTASVAQVPAKARTSRWRTGLRRLMKRKLVVGGGGALLAATLVAGTAAASVTRFEFEMVPSAATCQPDASGHVTVLSLGPVELMDVDVSGLPPKTDFDLFVIQVPHGPFGVSWYQGDIETNGAGKGHQQFIGRFSIETFAVAPGVQPAPTPHDGRDASTNPAFAPVHTYHLGLWFNSPADAVKAGCPGATTPFNGDHTAGVQVLNTKNFPDNAGPLINVTP